MIEKRDLNVLLHSMEKLRKKLDVGSNRAKKYK